MVLSSIQIIRRLSGFDRILMGGAGFQGGRIPVEPSHGSNGISAFKDEILFVENNPTAAL